MKRPVSLPLSTAKRKGRLAQPEAPMFDASSYKYHKLSEVSEWLWRIANEDHRDLTDEQRSMLNLFGMLIGQFSLAVSDFEHHWRGHATRTRGMKLIRHNIKAHWPQHWRDLVQEHVEVIEQRRERKH